MRKKGGDISVKNVVVENPKLIYNDGVEKLYLYTRGSKGGSLKLKELLRYLEETIPENAVDEELREMQNIVGKVKHRKDVGEHYMTLSDKTVLSCRRRSKGIAEIVLAGCAEQKRYLTLAKQNFAYLKNKTYQKKHKQTSEQQIGMTGCFAIDNGDFVYRNNVII